MTNSIKVSGPEVKQNRNLSVKGMLIGLSLILILIFGLYFWLTQPLIFKPQAAGSVVDISPARLEAHVRKLSEEFYPRNQASLVNLNKTADYIKSEFEKTGGAVTEQTFRVNHADYRNVSVVFGNATTERIVVGAHYDSAFETRGADDNASGVAGLIELARLFGENPPPQSIEMVAYTLEEPPFFGTEQMGSFFHAKSLDEERVKVRLMICLEMIGYFSEAPNSQDFPVSIGRLVYPTRGNFIAVVGDFASGLTVRGFKKSMAAATNLPVYSLNAPGFIPGVDFSDHRNYRRFGYPALMITDTAFYRNKNYHTVADTADTLDYARMAEVVKATYNAVLATAKD